MQAQKLKILIGSARAALMRAYEAHQQRPIHLDFVVQAHLHCRYVSGIAMPYDAQIEALEVLEQQYEDLTGDVDLARWRAMRANMRDMIDAGAIHAESVDRAAEFVTLIDSKLAGDDEPPLQEKSSGLEALRELLHPVVIDSSWTQYQAGHLRDAVLNAFVALGDFIRARTGLVLDGKALVEQALSPHQPRLVLSTLETESGRNDQSGFMQIFSGAFVGVRNPKAHSLAHDLDPVQAAQYLVFASLLARRVAEARPV